MSSVKEFENPYFEPTHYVEQLVWRVQGEDRKYRPGSGAFNAKQMLIAFESTIEELKLMSMKMDEKIKKEELSLQNERTRHAVSVDGLRKTNKKAFTNFQELDEHISSVATKVVHLGDQLEGVNTPRARDQEARKLIHYFFMFTNEFEPQAEIFSDPFQLNEAADVIQKLYLIAQELPADKFAHPKNRITAQYNAIEFNLINEFQIAHNDGDKQRMRELADILLNFKGYSRCVESFIETNQRSLQVSKDVYDDLMPICRQVNFLAQEVFSTPELVMGKFVQCLYQQVLKCYVQQRLSCKDDTERYLAQLYELYARTSKLTKGLSSFRLGSDSNFLNRQMKYVFGKYLEDYVRMEMDHLKNKMTEHLKIYYRSLNHTKKKLDQQGGLHELQNKLRTKTPLSNLNLGGSSHIDYKGEPFISQELSLNLLNESKLALTRCNLLSNQSDLPVNAVDIFKLLTHYLCIEHIDYALEIGLQGIPSNEPKTEPQGYFIDVAKQANAVFHLLEKLFSELLVPLISSSPMYSQCVQEKREIKEQMEGKIENGLDRTLNCWCGWIKHILSAEQKKSDFKPDSEEMPTELSTPACAKVLKFVDQQAAKLKTCLDGKNVGGVRLEFGIRFHRVILEHLQSFTYNSMGAMLVICDVNEYRRAAKAFQSPVVNSLFELLHALCNLLVVVPENLKQIITGEQMAGLDRSTVMSFVQLRADFKTAKIAQQLK
ncbi:exocyst complex component 5-like [Anneissia japonica]|uniref:exocyst complex component 5-like n=1 Tax=Anneissia japonica TaxID=1529436 RepID=UPI00142567EF|nr:exocyst complex component 5-like [Anneissia japonica]